MNTKMKVVLVGMLLVITLLTSSCGGQKSMPTGANAEWTLVVIGDSSMWELGEALASQIESDLGVKVVLEDFSLGSLSAGEVLEVLETGKSERFQLEALPGALKEAEMVVIFVNPVDSVNPENPLNLWGCFTSQMPENCPEEAYSTYVADMEEIWGKIIELRKGKPTILRATDIYNPLISFWEENGVFEACDVCWTNMSAANRKAAEKYGIPFLSRYDAYDGLNHKEDPRLKGFILPDGEHPTEEGAKYTAKLLSEMGYDPTKIK